MQNVKKLALIFVHPLCLNIKNSSRIDDNSLLFISVICKLLLFKRLDFI